MNWKLKANLYNLIDKLPNTLACNSQYWLQKSLGQLRHTNPIVSIKASILIAANAIKYGQKITGCSLIEVGTGRRINLPLTFWLLGISSILTVDLNPYLKWELIEQDLNYIKAHAETVKDLFSIELRPTDFETRWEDLLEINSVSQELPEVLNLNYIAPGDASSLAIASNSIDFHVSNSVLEHIPSESLNKILREGQRVIKPSGFLIHQIHLGDHRATGDSSLSSIDFLQYDEPTWNKLAGNRFMYHNRLRLEEYLTVFQDAGLEIVRISDREIDHKALSLLNQGFPLDQRFQHFDGETNATHFVQIIAR